LARDIRGSITGDTGSAKALDADQLLAQALKNAEDLGGKTPQKLLSISINPRQASSYHALGLDFFEAGRYWDAILLFQEAVRLDNNGESIRRLVETLAYEATVEEALKSIRTYVQGSKEKFDAYRQLAARYDGQGRYRDAPIAFERAVAIEPDAENYLHLARLYVRMNYLGKSLDAYENAIALDPDHYRARWEQLETLVRFRESRKAILIAKARIESRPNDTEAKNDLRALAHIIYRYWNEDVVESYNFKKYYGEEGTRTSNRGKQKEGLLSDATKYIQARFARVKPQAREIAARGIAAILSIAESGQTDIIDEFIKRAADATKTLRRNVRAQTANAETQLLAEFAPSLTDEQRQEILAEALAITKPPIPKLDNKQIAAIKRRAKARPWSGRPSHRMSAFDWVRENYSEWIPGLLQHHLKADSLQLYDAFAKRVSREGGLPDGLDVPTEDEAELRDISDPLERAKLLAVRRLNRERMRGVRSLGL
jgi:tetratricopeptide (TPR) repeat protein